MSPLSEHGKSIFLQTLDLVSAEDRQQFLAAACGDDSGLRQQIEELLAHHSQASSFLESPPTEVVQAAHHDTAREVAPPVLDFLAPSTEPAAIGRLGHYEILEVLGCGGFGVVLKARDSKLDRIVAVKTLVQSLASSATSRRRFVREAKAAAAVKHDNIVGIYHVSDEGSVPYLVMECVSGVSLEEKLRQDGMLELPVILRIGMQVAGGLAAAHKQGLVHRDVKPGNILLENGVERVKITDFGLARAVDDASITREGEVAGTPQYMSPEQAVGQSVDARSDLFSLGSVLYAMCTGRSPFRAETTVAALRRVCDDTPRPIREINPEIPAWLVAIIDRLLAKKPDERIQTAAEAADLLSQHLARLQHPGLEPKVTTVAQSQIPNPKSQFRDGRWLIAAAALVLLVVGISLTEATGVTHVVPTVLRIVTGEGTLVVETDPDVHVTLEGNGDLVFNLAGGQTIRVPTGRYRVRATKDGKPLPLEKDLVTISRGREQVVRVRLESDAASAKAAGQAEKSAFVRLGGKGVAERKFDTLAEAVHSASSGDTIEIRGNGPFVSDGVTTANVLVIRAGEGYTPTITLSQAASDKNIPLLNVGASLVLEGLKFQRISPAPQSSGLLFRVWHDGALHIANCRLVGGAGMTTVSAVRILTLRNCELLASGDAGIHWYSPARGRALVENCVISRGKISFIFRDEQQRGATLDMRGNTVAGDCISVSCHVKPKLLDETEGPAPLRVNFSGNVTRSSLREKGLLFFSQTELEQPYSLADVEFQMRHLIDLNEQQNVYQTGTRMFRLGTRRFNVSDGYGELAAWDRLWKSPNAAPLEGNVLFEGGDLANRASTAPEQLAAKDFRLRPDSAGYRAGKDGKDLGADVDLVGPGAAYERWKKTPEYQEWLKETGQLRAEAPKPESGAFVLVGAKGIEARKFDTLAEAVHSASSGDTIEVRGNGPFSSEPISIRGTALTIRTGEGFRPVIQLSSNLQTDAPLVLEGLELQHVRQKASQGHEDALVFSWGSSLHVANCRFQEHLAIPSIVASAPRCFVRSCEFLNPHQFALVWHGGKECVIDNCLVAGPALQLENGIGPAHDGSCSIQLTRNTLAAANPLFCRVFSDQQPPKLTQGDVKPIRVEASGNIFDATSVLNLAISPPFLTYQKPLQPKEAVALLPRFLNWRDRLNLYAPGVRFVAGYTEERVTIGAKNLAEWKQFWDPPEGDAIEGRVLYQGGNLVAKLRDTPEKLAPDDFRLRPDSAGYQAGMDNKDLGADIDLVGPGTAYERWKTTPGYQEWLKETGQVK
jgi:serine/threonine protein kinase